MKTIIYDLDTKRTGAKIVKVLFVYDNPQPLLKIAHSEFSKKDRMLAKADYKNSKNNTILHNEERTVLVEHLVKRELPNWNIKLGFLK